MNLRTVAIISALAIAPLSLVGCGDDTASTSTSATTVAETTTTEKETTTTEASGDETTTTVSGGSFGDQLPGLQAELDAAGGDACALAKLFDKTNAAGNPTTTQEVKDGVTFISALLVAIADSAPADQAADAEAIRAGATKFEADAAAVDYDPAKIGDAQFSPEALAGLQKFTELTKGC